MEDRWPYRRCWRGPGWRDAPSRKYVHADRGTVAVIAIPDAGQLASYTSAVAMNNRMRLASSGDRPQPPFAHRRRSDPGAFWRSVADRARRVHRQGNRTYDQVLGDIAKGNGDPSLVMFGKDVTPTSTSWRKSSCCSITSTPRAEQRGRASVDHAGERNRLRNVAGI